MQFPIQVVSGIAIRDANNNLVIQIGPGPDVWIYGQSNAIHLTPTSTAPSAFEAAIEFYQSTAYVPNPGSPASYVNGGNFLGPDAVAIEISSGQVATGQRGHLLLGPYSFFLTSDTATASPTPNRYVRASSFDSEAGHGVYVRPFFEVDDQGWRAPVYQNGWANNGGGVYEIGKYRMMPDGTVEMMGFIVGGVIVNGTIMFNLPAGLRPAKDHIFACSNGNATGSFAAVTAAGNVSCFGVPSAVAGIMLDNVRFPVSQLV